MIWYYMLLTACCGYALFRGGAPERIVGAALAAGWLATLADSRSLATRFDPSGSGGLLIACFLLLVLVAVALRADRCWPFLAAGLQLAIAGAYLLSLFDLQVARVPYAKLIAIWSVLIPVALAIGTWRHRRRLAVHGHDLAWSIRGKARREADAPAG